MFVLHWNICSLNFAIVLFDLWCFLGYGDHYIFGITCCCFPLCSKLGLPLRLLLLMSTKDRKYSVLLVACVVILNGAVHFCISFEGKLQVM